VGAARSGTQPQAIAADRRPIMRRIRYCVAMSLDGYIAGPNGEYDVMPVLLGTGRKVMAGCSRRIKVVQRPATLELPGHTLLVYDVRKPA
jgi:hypothetical protein